MANAVGLVERIRIARQSIVAKEQCRRKKLADGNRKAMKKYLGLRLIADVIAKGE